jgi:heat shock protein HslJ
MSTGKACPPEIMNLEQRYTAALQRAGNWGFRFRRLVVNYGEGEDFGSLVFEGREPSTQ